MECLYINKNNNKCNILRKLNCNNCSFYKDNTKANYKKFIINTEKDILIYSKRKNKEGS